MDEQYYTVNANSLNYIGMGPYKLTLTIDLSDEELTTSYFGRYEHITLVRNGEKYTFTPEEFIDGMNRMARTAKKVNVPRQDHLRIGHLECSLCGTPIGYNNRFCHHCGAKLLEDE